MTNTLGKDFIAKIEGHGSLEVDWTKAKIKLHVHEGERLFEGILVGRKAEEMAWITPRICGVCPTAHNLASLNAIENALGIEPTKETILLRELMNCGQMIQSHALHLFFLSLPDYLGIDRGTELADKNPKAFGDALALKEVSDLIVATVGGRIVHPMRSVIGGFQKVPSKNEISKLLKKLEKTAQAASDTLDLCSQIKWPKVKVNLELAAQNDREIIAVNSKDITKKDVSNVADYKKVIEEEVVDHSTAKFGRYKGNEMLVGSLARLAVYGNYDNKKYKVDFANPYHNNLAQAIEIVQYHQKALEIAKELSGMNLKEKIVKPKKNAPLFGIGVVEAPRGGLYHEVLLDKDSTIKEANIITPTVQNLTSIEKSGQALINQSKKRSKEEIERLVIMLIRAYDPCITCSVH